ncbi:MAG: UDP-2,4-diacetamido-2,4,6-trideoxy-beta-L-altropyranose hydrolase [Moraxellaceae bacterium]|nr:UDP-2,4-diacetamido-2,4,6-trideoxy-beta-L-altropyranose hydrolase [Moraxellaceae bacterium]
MQVVFRTDASELLGLGHAMRCFALAQALMRNGATATFLVRHMPASVKQRLLAAGINVIYMETGQPEEGADPRLGVSAARDAADTRRALAAFGTIHWLVVDHYALDAGWESSLRGQVQRIAVIDDLDDRPHDCDLLVDQNPATSDTPRYLLHAPPGALRLLGPRYALLRPEFATARELPLAVRRKLRRVLVAFGGADPAGGSAFVLAALAPLVFEGLSLDVVLGATAQGSDLARSVMELPNAQLHVDVADMTTLYRSADLAIGAAGTSAWERCAMGLPTVLLSLTEKQSQGAEALAALGGSVHLGRATAESIVALTGLVRALAHSPDWLSVLSRQAAEVCDGQGALRVAARMESFDMQLRLARLEDADDLLTWRNHEVNRRHAVDARPITKARHMEWMRQSLENADRVLLIAEDAVGPVGVLRYDIAFGIATVSIYLAPGRHGQGRGGVLLLAGEEWIMTHRPEVQAIDARILVENTASMNVFLESGYLPDSHHLSKALNRTDKRP